MKRRILAVLLCAVMLLAPAGCRAKKSTPTGQDRQPYATPTPNPTPDPTPKPTEEPHTTLSFGGIEFFIPECFGELNEEDSTETKKVFYPEGPEIPVKLEFRLPQDSKMSQQIFDAIVLDLLRQGVSQLETGNLIELRSISAGDLSGGAVLFSGKDNKTDSDVVIVQSLIFSKAEHCPVGIMLRQTCDYEHINHNYIENYDKIVEKAKVEANTTNTVSGTTTEMIGGIEFTIPAVLGKLADDESTETDKYYYPEGFGPAPLLYFHYYEAQISQSEFDSSKDELGTALVRSFGGDDAQILSTDDVLLDGLSGKCITFELIETDFSVKFIARLYLVYNPSKNAVITIIFTQVSKAENDLLDDFDKMIDSAKVITETPKPSASTPAADGVTPELKAFLDSYEAFMDEYVAFMKTYNDSNDVLGMLTDYLSMMGRYSDFVKALDELDQSEFSDADMMYYTEVVNRCSQKMLEAY